MKKLLLFACLFSMPACAMAQQPSAGKSDDGPETILASFHVKPGQLNNFLALMPKYWAELRAQNLVLAEPHLMMQGDENGKPVVYQLFSWRDHDVSDHVPASVQAYWDKMNGMLEARGGHDPVEFPEVKVLPRS